METTQISLLWKLQQRENSESDSWVRFVKIYAPLLNEWAVRLRVPEHDRQDLIQDTLLKLLTCISTFKRNENGTFRGWLFTILRNCWLDRVKRQQPLQLVEHSLHDSSSVDPQYVVEQEEYRQYIMRRVFSLIIADFPGVTQMAFRKYVIDGRPADEVARELRISLNALYLIRARVLKRLQNELIGLIDD